MKAYVIERAGGPEVLTLTDVPSPRATGDEVTIRVRAFGINRAEIYRRSGRMGPIERLVVPGIEAVGEVLTDPSGTLPPGRRVATAMGGMQFSRPGSYAEQVAVLRSNVIDLGDTTLSWEELAALPESYLTVWGALSRSLGLSKGQTLLVRGGTTSLGLAATVYAKSLGATVVATTRAEANRQRLLDVGADIVVVDGGQIEAEVRRAFPSGVDGALEVVGATSLRDTIKTLKPFGAVAVVGLLGGPPVLETFHLMQDLPSATRLSFFPSGLFGTPALPLTDTPLPVIARGISEGRIPSLRVRTFDFDDVRRAHELMESDRVHGKLVVRV